MAKETLKDKAYQIIKEKIISCEYMPSTFLNEMELVQEVGTSHTPIREALNRLEQENLVRILPKRGIYVTDLLMSDVRDVYEVRCLIEPYMLRQWGMLIPKDALRSYLSTCEELLEAVGSENDKFRLDDILHNMILKSCPNAYLSRTLSQLQDQSRRMRILSGDRHSRLKYSLQEHIDIVKCLLEEKYNEAAEAMVHHLQKGKESAIDLLMENRQVAI